MLNNKTLDSVVTSFFDAYIQTRFEINPPTDFTPDFYKKAKDKYINALHKLTAMDGEIKKLTVDLDDAKAAMDLCETEHYYKTGFAAGMEYATYILNLANQLNTSNIDLPALLLEDPPKLKAI